MRSRSAIILLHGENLCLIERKRAGRTYYLFPGGGVEPGENPEQAAKREAYEELGLLVELERLVARLSFRGDQQYYYLARVVGGEFGSGTGEEMAGMEDSVHGSYTPVWMPLEETLRVDARPRELCKALRAGHLLTGKVLVRSR